MKLLFKLTMPNVGSWNGQWTGENNNHVRTRKVSKSKATEVLGEKEVNDFYYNFGDGWGANVEVVSYVRSLHYKKVKNTTGFSGYDWMIDSILKRGKITTER